MKWSVDVSYFHLVKGAVQFNHPYSFFYPLHLSCSDRGVLRSPNSNSGSFHFSLQFYHFLPHIVSPFVKGIHFRDCYVSVKNWGFMQCHSLIPFLALKSALSEKKFVHFLLIRFSTVHLSPCIYFSSLSLYLKPSFCRQHRFCLLGYFVIFSWLPGILYWIKGTVLNRPLVMC